MLELNKVYCMDALEGIKLIPDESINCIITDPPYDVDYGEKSSFLEKLGKAGDKQTERDKHFTDKFNEYETLSKEMFRVAKQNSHIYIFCSDKQLSRWKETMINAGFKTPQLLVWIKNKTTFDMTFGHKYPENKELILFFQKGWKKLNGYSVERHLFRSTLYFDSSKETEYHSCAKPQDLLMFLTKLSTNKGDLCLDCFAGSGSHLLSFMKLKRNFIGFEINDHYYSIINKRLEDEKTQVSLEVF